MATYIYVEDPSPVIKVGDVCYENKGLAEEPVTAVAEATFDNCSDCASSASSAPSSVSSVVSSVVSSGTPPPPSSPSESVPSTPSTPSNEPSSDW